MKVLLHNAKLEMDVDELTFELKPNDRFQMSDGQLITDRELRETKTAFEELQERNKIAENTILVSSLRIVELEESLEERQQLVMDLNHDYYIITEDVSNLERDLAREKEQVQKEIKKQLSYITTIAQQESQIVMLRRQLEQSLFNNGRLSIFDRETEHWINSAKSVKTGQLSHGINIWDYHLSENTAVYFRYIRTGDMPTVQRQDFERWLVGQSRPIVPGHPTAAFIGDWERFNERLK